MAQILVLFDTEVEEDCFETDHAKLFKNCSTIEEVETKMEENDMEEDLFDSPAVIKIADDGTISIPQSLSDIDIEIIE